MSASERPAATTYCEECGATGGKIHAFSCSQYPEIEGAGRPAASVSDATRTRENAVVGVCPDCEKTPKAGS